MTGIGICRFCGQSIQLEPKCNADQDKLDEIATMQCTCDEAKHYQNMVNLDKEIDEMWGEGLEEQAKLTKAAVKLLDRGQIAAFRITKNSQLNITGKKSAKNEIKIKKTEKYADEISV